MTNSLYFSTNEQDYSSQLASTLFAQANGPTWRRLLPARLRPQERPLPILSRQSGNAAGAVAPSSVQRVALEQVRGSVSQARSQEFNADFRPVKNHLHDRWVRVAQASFQQKVLPPVELVRAGDAYFVMDGHHRVSVAKTLGHDEILAQVTVWEMAS
jgi:hypothetical protein